MKESRIHNRKKILLMAGYTAVWGLVFLYIYSVCIQNLPHEDETAAIAWINRAVDYGEWIPTWQFHWIRIAGVLFYFLTGWRIESVYLPIAFCIFTIIVLSYSMVRAAVLDNSLKERIIVLESFILVMVLISPATAFYLKTHTSVIIFSMIGFSLSSRYFHTGALKYLIYSVIFTIWSCFPFDNLYFAVFIVPLLLFFSRTALESELPQEKKRAAFILLCNLFFLMAGIFVFHCVKTEQDMSNPGYLGTSFIVPDRLWEKLNLYFTGVLSLFDADYTGMKVNSFAGGIRFFRAFIIFCTVCRMIKVLIDWTAYDPKKHDPNERERRRKWKYQLSVFSALSVLSVSLTWIITDAAASEGHVHYMNAVIVWGGYLPVRILPYGYPKQAQTGYSFGQGK